MSGQILKTGIIKMDSFVETEAASLLLKNDGTLPLALPYSYTPVKDATNSCINACYAEFDTANITTSTVFRIVANVSWSGFDTSSTAGTFSMHWQGDTYKPSTSTWVWEGHNTINSALETQYGLKNLVLSATSGSYTYNTTFTLDSTFISTYTRGRIGIRTDYSNGVGKISINNIYVIEDKYSSTGSAKAHIGEDFMSGRELNEVN